MRSAKDPDLKIDWKLFNSIDRVQKGIEVTAENAEVPYSFRDMSLFHELRGQYFVYFKHLFNFSIFLIFYQNTFSILKISYK